MKTMMKILFPVSLLMCAGCASSPGPASPTSTASASDELRDSQVEIKYSLAQNFYRLQVAAKNGEIEALSGVNEQPLERRKIGRDKYLSFVNRASLIARAIQGEGKRDDVKDCKTPYALKVSRIGEAPLQIAGCRSHDPEGRIGRLIQEGEFLFYTPSVQ